MVQATGRSWPWVLGALLLVLVVALALRFGTNVLKKGATFDEPYIVPPIENLVNEGWSVANAIDFKETKGPAFIWAYAIGGEMLGGELNSLRLVSIVFFVLGAVPLLWIARRCGLGGPSLLVVAALYVLLPYNAGLGQLVMSEPSFICGSLLLVCLFVWGFGTSKESEARILGPIAFGVVLSILLHHRMHAVALAGAACLVAFERDRWRSWPWWLACVAAGLSRVPLLIRWGGFVSPSYQSAHGLGFSADSLTYLAAACLPFTALFLWTALAESEYRTRRWLVWAGGAIGLALGLFASPSLTEVLPLEDIQPRRFLGIMATAVRTIAPSPGGQWFVFVVLSAIGAASLGALTAVAWQKPATNQQAVVTRFLALTVLTGWGLYALTHSVVYDRYVVPWAAIVPIVWVATFRKWALVLQALGLAAILCWQVWRWLVSMPSEAGPDGGIVQAALTLMS
ncbi:MAG: hypothetical protein ACYTFF_08430 [Planctomycetota bacterium]|jgi:hypothetical protein